MRNSCLLVLGIFGILFYLNSCKSDNKNNPDPESCSSGSRVVDVDGNLYHVTRIGKQCWLRENLSVSRFRNGDAVKGNLGNPEWKTTTKGAFSVYADQAVNNLVYGKLYNWYAVSDPRGLCPSGWHVATETEWDSLVNALGGQPFAGGALKAVDTTYWKSPNAGATNSSGFSGLPGGARAMNGSFENLGRHGEWWTGTPDSGNRARSRSLSYYTTQVGKDSYSRQDGFSVRCVKD